ncbi:MAG: DUF116 domain-containing protein [Thermodesulfobacteriota bacterium]
MSINIQEGLEHSADSIEYKPGKGIFLVLLIVCAVVIIAGGFFFWYVPTVGLTTIHPALPYIVGVIFASVGTFVVGGGIGIFYSVLTGRETFLSGPFRWLLLKIYMPLMLMAGKLFHISKIRIERTFLDINNQMVLAMRARLNPERLLILMPHCIQYDECKIKVTKEVTNCVSCGKCEIADLLAIQEEYGVNLFVSTGGTVARRKVVELRPDAVVAVACERDLISGVQDAFPLPVYGIVNKRPMGYCTETGVAIEDVKEAVERFLN